MAKDLEAVINSSIDSAVESGDISAEDAADDGVVEQTNTDNIATRESETTEKVVEKPASETKTEELDALLEEFIKDGFKPDKREKVNKIPYPNVQKIIGNREKRAIDAVAKSLGVDAKTLKFEGLEAAITEKLTSYSDLESEAENFRRAEDIAMNDADRYIRILATIEPNKYGKFLSVLDKVAGKADETNTDEASFKLQLPEPDYDLGNGAKTYTPQGLQKAIESAVLQAIEHGKKEARTEAERVVNPIKQERAREQHDRERDAFTNAELNRAMKWRGMETHFDKVLEALKNDTKQATVRGKLDKSRLNYHSIHDAYIDIVPALLSDESASKEQEMRKKIIEEQQQTTRSTSVDTSSVRKSDDQDGGSGDKIIDAINRSLAKAGL